MLSPEMAGTVKLPAPELALDGELVALGEVVALGELVVLAEAVAVTEGSAAAERVLAGEADEVGDEPGVPVSADVSDPASVAAKAAAEPPGAGADTVAGGAEGLDPLAAHAVRPAPPMTAAMITAGTRHILMLLPSGE